MKYGEHIVKSDYLDLSFKIKLQHYIKMSNIKVAYQNLMQIKYL